MPDLPTVLSFGHHLIPLLPQSGAAGASGGKVLLPAVKAACKSAERIHSAIRMAGRFELAVVPDVPDFFDADLVNSKARNHAWETIRESPRLYYVIPTRRPDLITSSLPPTWIGKGFQNVCIGYMADAATGLAENLQALRNAPLQHRMILLSSSSPPIDRPEHLQGIDWVVLTGNPGDAALAEVLGAACRKAGATFLFHQSDGQRENASTIGDSEKGTQWPTHPFGSRIDLSQPTLPNLMTDHSAAPAINISQATPAPASPPPTAVTVAANGDACETDHVRDQGSDVAALEIVTRENNQPPSGSSLPLVMGSDRDDFARLDSIVRRGMATFIEVGRALAEIRDRELWRAGSHPSWAAYCLAVGGLTKIHANRLIKGSEVASNIAKVKPTGFTCPDVTPRAEWQIRPLHRLPDAERQSIAWFRAVKLANGQPTEKMISDVVAELMADGGSTTSSKPNRKKLAAETIARIRKLSAAGGAHQEIDTLLNELETLLKLA